MIAPEPAPIGLGDFAELLGDRLALPVVAAGLLLAGRAALDQRLELLGQLALALDGGVA